MFEFLVAILNFRFLMYKSTDISETNLDRDLVLAARYTKSILRSLKVALILTLTLTFTAKGLFFLLYFHLNIYLKINSI